MKKLIILLATALLFLVPAFAQVDIQVVQLGPFISLGSGLTWANNPGIGTIDNNFIVRSPSSNGLCLFLRNNDASSHTVNFAAFTTGDQNVIAFAGNAAKWQQTSQTITGTTSLTPGAASTIVYYVPTGNAANVALTFSGSSGSGTADLFVTQSSVPCDNPVPTLVCNKSIGISIGPSNTGTVLAPAVAGKYVYPCSVDVSWSGAPTAIGAAIQIGFGSSGLCTGGLGNVWQFGSASSNPFFVQGQGGSIVSPGALLGQNLCVQTGAFGAVTANINVRYATF